MNTRRLFFPALALVLFLWGTTVLGQENYLTLRMLTYNIHHGAGTDDVMNLDRQAEVMLAAEADVIGLQEVDSCVKRSGRTNEAAYLAKALGMHATFGAAIPLTGGSYGMAVLSKEKPLSVRHLPLPGVEKRTLLVCEFQDYVYACTHLDLNDSCRMASLPIIVEEAKRWEKPFFICGDWNVEPTSTLIRQMKSKGFKMLSYATVSSTYYTFPASKPTRIIDYIASYGSVVKAIRLRRVINEASASDHRPVLIEVKLPSYATGIGEVSIDAEEAETSEDGRLKGRSFDLSGRPAQRHSNGSASPRIIISDGKKTITR